MNVSKAVELAFAEAIRTNAKMGEGVAIRAWQSLKADGSWKENPDRTFPLVDVRCSPPATDDSQSNLRIKCAILMGTKTDDDKSHAFISNMYEKIQEVCDDLFSVFRQADLAVEPLAAWLASIDENTDEGAFNFGGLTFEEGLDPADDNGINMIGIAMVVAYSKTGF